MLILFGNRNDETQIGCHKFLFCLFSHNTSCQRPTLYHKSGGPRILSLAGAPFLLTPPPVRPQVLVGVGAYRLAQAVVKKLRCGGAVCVL